MDYDFSPLMKASYEGDKKTVRRLLKMGANVNAKNTYGTTALMLASARGNLDIVKFLLKAGAKVNCRNKAGRTALMSVVSMYFWKINIYTEKKLSLQQYIDSGSIVNLLIKAGAKINIKDIHGNTALLLAAESLNLRKHIDILLKAKANVNIQNNYGYTALMYCSSYGDVYSVKLLLRAGADKNRYNSNFYAAKSLAKKYYLECQTCNSDWQRKHEESKTNLYLEIIQLLENKLDNDLKLTPL